MVDSDIILKVHRPNDELCLWFYNAELFVSDVDECVLGTDNCDPVATCTNIEGTYTCSCPAGYTGSGITGECQSELIVVDFMSYFDMIKSYEYSKCSERSRDRLLTQRIVCSVQLSLQYSTLSVLLSLKLSFLQKLCYVYGRIFKKTVTRKPEYRIILCVSIVRYEFLPELLNLSHVMIKAVYVICELQRRRSACDQRLCYLLPI